MYIPQPQGHTLQGILQPLFQFQPYCEGFLATAEKNGCFSQLYYLPINRL